MTNKNLKLTNVPDDYIHFASFGRPHGLKGGFFLKTEDRRTVWDGYKNILVEFPEGFVEKKVLRHYLSGGALVLELEGITARETIESLYNKKICVRKNQIKLNEDEYLVDELLNFQVRSEEKIIGKIIGLVSYGAQENLQIQLLENNQEVLYPFIDKFILNIDKENNVVEIVYLEEFLAG